MACPTNHKSLMLQNNYLISTLNGHIHIKLKSKGNEILIPQRSWGGALLETILILSTAMV